MSWGGQPGKSGDSVCVCLSAKCSGQIQEQVRRPWGRKEQCDEKLVIEERMGRDEVDKRKRD